MSVSEETRKRYSWGLQQAAGFVAVSFKREYWRDANCLFVLSCGRVGTETLAKLLALSPRVCAFHEPAPQLLDIRNDARVRIDQRPKHFQHEFCRARATSIAAAKLSGRWYAETSARLTFLAPAIAELLPNARFILLTRHPGDVVRSGIRRRWYAGHPCDLSRIRPVRGETFADEWDSWSQFHKVCWYWSAYYQFIMDFVDRLPLHRWLSTPSEALFERRPETIGTLFEFLNLPVPDNSALQGVLEARHNAQQEGQFPSFPEWTHEQRATLYRIAGPMMERLGYRTGLECEL